MRIFTLLVLPPNTLRNGLVSLLFCRWRVTGPSLHLDHQLHHGHHNTNIWNVHHYVHFRITMGVMHRPCWWYSSTWSSSSTSKSLSSFIIFYGKNFIEKIRRDISSFLFAFQMLWLCYSAIIITLNLQQNIRAYKIYWNSLHSFMYLQIITNYPK